MHGTLLLAAEPRGDCNLWRLSQGFWDAVQRLEGRQQTPINLDALLRSLRGCVDLASTIRDATASFALRFPCTCALLYLYTLQSHHYIASPGHLHTTVLVQGRAKYTACMCCPPTAPVLWRPC